MLTRLSAIILLAALTSCSSDSYDVLERSQKEVPNLLHDGNHTEVLYVLKHDGHTIHAVCDAYEISNASCGFRPLHSYHCTLGDDRIGKATYPMGDLKCKDADGRDVYLYVDKTD